MSRVTAPVSKLTRSINSAAAGRSSGLLDSHHNAGAVLMPKYAELLKNRRTNEPDTHSRGITTTHRPTPQPKPSATHARPLMQTFSTAPRTAARADTSTIDFAVLPSATQAAADADGLLAMRMPLLPDAFTARHSVADAADAPLAAPEILVVAAHPENVSPSALTEVEGMGIDGVELKFAHDTAAVGGEGGEGGMLRDLWKGLVDDVLGDAPKPKPAF